MQYTLADVFLYQVLVCLIKDYDYRIVHVASSRKDLWLVNEQKDFPIVRLNPSEANSIGFEKEYLEKVKVAIEKALPQAQDNIVVINTNDKSIAFEEENVRQIVIQEYLIGNPILETFPRLVNYIKEVESYQDECARLTRELENYQRLKMMEERKKTMKFPIVSTIISAIIAITMIVVFLLEFSDGGYLYPILVSLGGYYKAVVVEFHEYYRIVTTTIFQPDIFTTFIYIFTLIRIGSFCESKYGKLRYLVIFLISALVGNVFVFIFDSNVIHFGIGGGIFGVLASLLLYVWESKLYKSKLRAIQLSNVYLLAFICISFSGISIFAYLGGFISGLFLAFVLYPTKSFVTYRIHYIISYCILLSALGYMSTTIHSALPSNEEFNTELIKQYETKNPEFAEALENRLPHKGD